MITDALALVNNQEKCLKLSQNILRLATPHATEDIVDVIATMLKK